jgi:hypothetical protein
MNVIKRIFAIILWVLAASAIISIITGMFSGELLPLSIALICLYYRWGKDLWCIDKDLQYISAMKKTLFYILVYISNVAISAIFGITISFLLGNGSSIVTNWSFAIILLILLSVWSPKKLLLKRQLKYTLDQTIQQTETIKNYDEKSTIKPKLKPKIYKWSWVKKWDNTKYNKIFAVTYGLYFIISLMILVDSLYADAIDYILILALIPYIIYFSIRIFVSVKSRNIND